MSTRLKLGGRNLSTIVGAFREPRHYRALWNLARGTPTPARFLGAYLTGAGKYPRRVTVRTPAGEIAPMLYSHHDLLTINEIFFRCDYATDGPLEVVVDIGSNIGISALYFLTRNPGVRVYLYEPVPENLERLRENLRGHEARVAVNACAVGDVAGEVEFGVEPTGRYGGIGVPTGQTIRVPCREINDVLSEVLEREGFIDVLKLDTEGLEARTVLAISPSNLERIGHILLEGQLASAELEKRFVREQYGPITRLRNRSPGVRRAS